ncbi:MAG: efflux RND transporter permease subunit, partial [Gammaproteobacteria bacterium]
LGVTAKNIADELRNAIHGATALEIQRAGEVVDVVIKRAGQDMTGIEDIQELPIRTAGGDLVALSVVAELEPAKGYARLHRINGQLAVTVQGSLDPEVVNAKELMNITKKRLLPELKKQYPGVRVQFVGQGKETADTMNSLVTNLAIGLFGVFAILSLQFKGYTQPLAVMLAIPTALIGVVAGHLLMGLDLSMPSLVGLATLVGVVVNDSILLVGFISERSNKGAGIVEAAVDATRDRFQAVLLTSLTTVAGLMPLLLETSTQAQVLIPLVASLAFGLTTATIMSLFVVPAICVILDEFDLFGRENRDSSLPGAAGYGQADRGRRCSGCSEGRAQWPGVRREKSLRPWRDEATLAEARLVDVQAAIGLEMSPTTQSCIASLACLSGASI